MSNLLKGTDDRVVLKHEILAPASGLGANSVYAGSLAELLFTLHNLNFFPFIHNQQQEFQSDQIASIPNY